MDELDQFLNFPHEEAVSAPMAQSPVLTVEEILAFDPSSVPNQEVLSPYVFPRSPEVPLTGNLDGFRYSRPDQMVIPELRITHDDDTFGNLGISLSHLEENNQEHWSVQSPLPLGSLAPPASPYLAVPKQSTRRDSVSSIHSSSSFLDLDSLDIHDDISEGYLSPSTAISQGWDPQIVCVPSPLISIIPSPMAPIVTTTHSPSMTSTVLKPILPKTEIPAESMSRFWESNSGLGLVDPTADLKLVSQDPQTQDSFQKMLVSLGLYPSDDSMQDGEEDPSEESQKEGDNDEAPCKQSEKMSSNDTLYEREQSASLDSLATHEKKKPFWTVIKSDRRTLYQCPYPDCLKTFTRPYNLKSHYRGHTGERPFACDQCQLAFTRKHDLKRHIKLHQGIRPFTCNVCQKSFARSDALKRHLKNADTGKESACLLKMKLDEVMAKQNTDF